MKMLVVMGTRPEAIKLAPVILAIRKMTPHNVLLCTSGQHGEMLAQALEDFGLKADIVLPSPRQAPALDQLTSHLLAHMTRTLETHKPDWVFVQGDTTTVFATTLAAFYQQIAVAHVEAGLRSFDQWAPFPEEMNRRLTAQMAQVHFAPTATARDNLVQEGVPADRIVVTGNTIVDALDYIKPRLGNATLPQAVTQAYKAGQKLVLVTCHRRENFGARLETVCQAITALAAHHPHYSFIWPVHPNPKVHETVFRLCNSATGNLVLCPPLPYTSLLAILARATLAISDSGGIQEEAPSFGCPVLVLRENTERPEGVTAGLATLVGTNSETICKAAESILTRTSPPVNAPNPYGDGHAAERIAAYFK